MLVKIPVPALAAAAALLAGAPAARTPLQDSVEWPEPTSITPLRVNPPTFRWPAAANARSFELQFSRSQDFRNAAEARADADFYRPLKRFDAGVWYWRVRVAEGQWSAPESFTINADLPVWELPEWQQLLDRIPKGRPRILLRPEEVAAYRARAAGPQREMVRQWAASLQRQLGSAFETRRAPGEQADESGDAREGALRRQKVATWDAKAGSHRLMDSVAEMSWMWMLTGEEKYADEVRRRVLAASRLDPEKDLSDRTSDFANANIVAQSAIAYDMLHERFSESERAQIRAMLLARAEPIIRKIERSPRKLFAAHGWQRAYAEGLMGALALYGEEPAAARWVETGLKTFVALYPWYGGRDGGSAEGTNYYTCTSFVIIFLIRIVCLIF